MESQGNQVSIVADTLLDNLLKTSLQEYNKEYVKEYHKQHPEVGLKSKQKQFKKLSNELGIFPYNKIPMALYSWSKTVKKIHGNYCDVCGITKGIEVHHIFHKANYPLLSLNENNGIPLCKLCHLQAHGRMLFI